MQDWWRTAFDDRYMSFYRPILTPARTEREVAFVRAQLGLDFSAVLDVPCGFGRHSIALAKLGYQVTGVDYSELMLQKAQQDAQSAKVGIDFRQADMRKLPFKEGDFDSVIMLFNSFGYLGQEEDPKVIAELARVLRPGGRLILDQQNPWPAAYEAEKIGTEIKPGHFMVSAPLDQHEGMEQMVWQPAERLMTIGETWNDDTGTRHFSYQLTAYAQDELEKMLQEAGFAVNQVYGDFDGNAFKSHSQRMIFVATR